jgi:hypothetical protein
VFLNFVRGYNEGSRSTCEQIYSHLTIIVSTEDGTVHGR